MAPAGHSRVMVCRKSILEKAGDRGWGVWEGEMVDGYERQGMVDASGTKAAIGDGRGVVSDGKGTMVVVVDGAAVVGRGGYATIAQHAIGESSSTGGGRS